MATDPPIEPWENFGVRLKAWRLDRRWTIGELARRSGVNWNTIRNAERGPRCVNLATACKLARALDCSVHWMATGDTWSQRGWPCE